MKIVYINIQLLLITLCLFINCPAQEQTTAYLENAYMVIPPAELIQGRESIDARLLELGFKIESEMSMKRVPANRDSSIHYEIAGFKTSDGVLFKQLLVLSKENDSLKKELEVLAKAGYSKDVMAEIDAARKRWVELCNAHNASELVNQVYTKIPFYYNHRPMITTSEALSKEYSYMNRPAYNLKLTPIHVEPVTQELVFEIGQCSGSYNGKYVIVWIIEQGNWKVLLDSNI